MITIIIIAIITGILLGFAKSARTPSDGLEDLTRNIIVATAGAFAGMQVAGMIFGSAEASVSVTALTIAAISGAPLLLFVINRVRRA